MLQLITTNRNKFEEFKEKAQGFGLEIEMTRIDYIEIQHEDLETIALDSARRILKQIRDPFFLEDSGLFVDDLGGFPGPYSSYVFSTLGNQGILDLLGDDKKRAAAFLSIICYHDGKDLHTFRGEARGHISDRKRGKAGFGFDPIFMPQGQELTFAELGSRKNEFSHRALSAEIFFRSVSNSFKQ